MTESFTSASSFSEIQPSRNVSEIHTWGLRGPGAWSETTVTSENLDEKVQVWEAQALGLQNRSSLFKKPASESDLESVAIPKQESPVQTAQVMKQQPKELTLPLWSNKIEYFLAQLSCSLNPFHFWNFPWMWLINGGIYVIVYITLLFSIGVPLLLMEMASGQKQRQGSLGVWKLASPWMTGLGYSSFLVCIIQSTLINIFNSWSLLYLSQSFQFPLPWDKCPLVKNSSDFDAECARTTPSKYFWYRTILKIPDEIDNDELVIPNINLSLLVTWCIIGVIMINGLKYIGKALSISMLIICLIFLCLLIRFPLMEGFSFLLPHLMVFKVPNAQYMIICFLALKQVLYTMGLGLGIVASFSSYIAPSNNCVRDAFIVPLLHLGTVMVATPIVFSVTSFWAVVSRNSCSEKNVEKLMKLIASGQLPPEANPPKSILANAATMYTIWLNNLPPSVKVMVLKNLSDCDTKSQILKVKVGSNFAFLAIIEAMSFIPGSSFWSTLLFLVILTLGLMPVLATMQGIITPLQYTFSFFMKHPKILIVSVSTFMFLCNLFFARPSGYYFFRLIKDHWLILPTTIIITTETLAIAWVYGANRLLEDMKMMMGRPISPIYQFLLRFLCPVVMITMFVATLIVYNNQKFSYVAWDSSTSSETIRQYPSWVFTFLIILCGIVFLPIPAYCLYSLINKIPFSAVTLQMPVRATEVLVRNNCLEPSKDTHPEEILEDDTRN